MSRTDAAPQLQDEAEAGMNRAAAEWAQRLEVVLESIQDGLLAVDRNWRIDLVNTCAASLLGHPRDALLKKDFRAGVDIAVVEAVRHVMERRLPFSFEHFSNAGGRWLDYRLSPLPDGGAVVYFVDITERKLAAERALLVAQHDALTGLSNRKLLREEAERILAAARRQGHRIAVLFLDLDRFKPINDNHGHEVGDKLLKAVARRIGRKLRAEDVVGRIGGDEFVAVLVGIKDPDDAAHIAANIVEALGRPYRVNGMTLEIGVSVGISLYPTHGETIGVLFKRADAAMYAAKRGGRSRFAFYAHGIETAAAAEPAGMAERLQAALAAGELSLDFQPVFSSDAEDAVEAEALLRWRQPDGSVIAPEEFLPIAESTGLIDRIGDWLLREACGQHQRWAAEGLGEITVGVTISGAHFRRKDFAQHVAAVIAESGIDPARLLVNIAESAVVANVDESVRVLGELRNTGIGVAIKNFGAGQSNVRALTRLPVDRIRVDRSILHRNGSHDGTRGNGNGHATADAIISLGQSLHRKVVAEGIENEADMDYVRTRGVDYCQGYLLGAPMPAADFADWWLQRKGSAGAPPRPQNDMDAANPVSGR